MLFIASGKLYSSHKLSVCPNESVRIRYKLLKGTGILLFVTPLTIYPYHLIAPRFARNPTIVGCRAPLPIMYRRSHPFN